MWGGMSLKMKFLKKINKTICAELSSVIKSRLFGGFELALFHASLPHG